MDDSNNDLLVGRKPKEIILTTFSSIVKTKDGKKQSFETIGQVRSALFSKHSGVVKKIASEVFIPAKFKSYPAKRRDNEIEAVYGIVIDVDNEEANEENGKQLVDKPVFFDSTFELLVNLNISFIMATSYSHQMQLEKIGEKSTDKFRIVLFYDTPVNPKYVPITFELINKYLFDNNPAIDQCGKKISQPYFVPSCLEENLGFAKIRSHDGLYLSSRHIKAKYLEEENNRNLPKKDTKIPSIKPLDIINFNSPFKGYDIKEWIESMGMKIVKEKDNDGIRIYEVKVCPMNEDHDDCSACFGVFPNGSIFFKCHHNGCANNNWNNVWKKLDPDLYKYSNLEYKDILKIMVEKPPSKDNLKEYLDLLTKSEIDPALEEDLIGKIAESSSLNKSAIRRSLKNKVSTKKLKAKQVVKILLDELGHENIISNETGVYIWN